MILFDTTTTTKKIALVVLAGCCVCLVAISDVNAINIPDQIKQSVEAQIHKKMQPNIVDEAKVIAVPKEETVCEDKHLNKIECKEWAWFGEWYVPTFCCL
jgi:negative regulator of sigma E activity